MSLKAKASGKGKLTYKSSSTKLATVNTKGTVTGKRAGKVTVTVTAGETKNYKKAVQKVTVYVTPQKMGTAALSSKQKGKLTVKWKKLAGVSGYESDTHILQVYGFHYKESSSEIFCFHKDHFQAESRKEVLRKDSGLQEHGR